MSKLWRKWLHQIGVTMGIMSLLKLTVIGIVVGVLLIVLINIFFVKYNGDFVEAPSIPRGAQYLGAGEPLTYVVLGDSTAVGMGGDYQDGIVIASAKLLAQRHKVEFYNLGDVGARFKDVRSEQLQKTVALKPDIVLISAGANDVTHLTSIESVINDTREIINELRSVNPKIEIAITGSPDMGAVPRFAQPLRYIAKLRTNQLNKAFEELNQKESFTLIPLAAKTGKLFSENPELFAKDKFHPTTEGYQVWVPIVNESIAAAINE